MYLDSGKEGNNSKIKCVRVLLNRVLLASSNPAHCRCLDRLLRVRLEEGHKV
jgi:hypothetical protein